LKSKSNDKKVLFINVYGYILPIEVDADIEDNTSIRFLSNEGKGECSCNVSGSCPRNSKLGIVWCDSSGCTDCSLKGIIANDQGEKMDFVSHNGIISLK